LKKGYILNGDRPSQLASLLKIIDTEQIGALMAVSEGDLLWLDEHKDSFQEVIMLIPGRDQLKAVLDKSIVYSAAKDLGIPLPKMIEPTSPGDAQKSGLRFPVITKWADPNNIMPLLIKNGIEFEKCEYAYDPLELENILKRYEKVGRYPVVQEFCPGYGLGQMFLIHKGKAILYFQHRRVHEWPPEGGFSTLCEPVGSQEHNELREQSFELLKSLQWEGVAMVEYRYDPSTRQSALMEINGRFWGSLPLAHYAGAEFAWEWYKVRIRGEMPASLNQYSTGFRCAYMVPELKRLFVILFAKKRIRNRALRFSAFREIASVLLIWINPRSRYYVFSLVDPKPFVMDIKFMIRDKLIRKIL
jgi:predicted ATP-grasp superfamily ATP-dependent carboligase